MRRGRLVSGAAALILAGCGGSGQESATTHSTPASATTAGSAPSGLYAHVLTNGELPGLTAQTPTIERDPRLYLVESQIPTSQLNAETARLKRLGFVVAVTENFTGSGQSGLSLVEQLGSPAAARAELVRRLKQDISSGPGFATFRVTGIPGAVGFSFTGGQGSGINIAWADGPYYYVVGETVGAVNPSAESSLNAAARHLYQRTHG